jgi:hypothetical protein
MLPKDYLKPVYPKITVKQLAKILKNSPKEITKYNWSVEFMKSWKMRMAKRKAGIK